MPTPDPWSAVRREARLLEQALAEHAAKVAESKRTAEAERADAVRSRRDAVVSALGALFTPSTPEQLERTEPFEEPQQSAEETAPAPGAGEYDWSREDARIAAQEAEEHGAHAEAVSGAGGRGTASESAAPEGLPPEIFSAFTEADSNN